MTECELSSFTFAPLGLWGEANKPRDLSASDFTIFAGFGGHTNTSDFFVMLEFADICFPRAVAQLH